MADPVHFQKEHKKRVKEGLPLGDIKIPGSALQSRFSKTDMQIN